MDAFMQNQNAPAAGPPPVWDNFVRGVEMATAEMLKLPNVDLNNAIESIMGRIDARLDAMSTRIDEQFREVSTRIDEQFREVREGQARMNTRLDALGHNNLAQVLNNSIQKSQGGAQLAYLISITTGERIPYFPLTAAGIANLDSDKLYVILPQLDIKDMEGETPARRREMLRRKCGLGW